VEKRHLSEEKPRQGQESDMPRKMPLSSRQMECSRKRTLVAQTLSRYPREEEVASHSGPKRADRAPLPRRPGQRAELISLCSQRDPSASPIEFQISPSKTRVNRT